MKILIWFACIVVNALIHSLLGIKGGAIPTLMFWGSAFSIAKNFSSRYQHRKNKTSEEYFEAGKGLVKGFLWYGAAILYCILGTWVYSGNPASFDAGGYLVIAVACVGGAAFVHSLINAQIKYILPKRNDLVKDETATKNNTIKYCRKCGAMLNGGSGSCIKCGTEIKDEV